MRPNTGLILLGNWSCHCYSESYLGENVGQIGVVCVLVKGQSSKYLTGQGLHWICWICGGSELPELQAKRHRLLMSTRGEQVNNSLFLEQVKPQ